MVDPNEELLGEKVQQPALESLAQRVSNLENSSRRSPISTVPRVIYNNGYGITIILVGVVYFLVGTLFILSYPRIDRIYAMFWALASIAIGLFTGLLFGLPISGREIQDEPLRVHTNLEQISDWITKIIVGIGLFQLKSLPGLISSFTGFVATGLSTSTEHAEAAKPLALALILYFGLVGFVFGYEETRTFVFKALKDAELKNAEQKLKDVEQKQGTP